jgi:hypothetical protein
MKLKWKKSLLSIVIFPSPSVADPAHQMLYTVPYFDESGVRRSVWFAGTRVERFLVKVLHYFILRSVERHNKWAPEGVAKI